MEWQSVILWFMTYRINSFADLFFLVDLKISGFVREEIGSILSSK
jgi:hypothetical protein